MLMHGGGVSFTRLFGTWRLEEKGEAGQERSEQASMRDRSRKYDEEKWSWREMQPQKEKRND